MTAYAVIRLDIFIGRNIRSRDCDWLAILVTDFGNDFFLDTSSCWQRTQVVFGRLFLDFDCVDRI